MAEEDNATEAAAEAAGGGKMKMIIFAVIGLVLVAIGIFAGPAVMNMISPPEPETDVAAEPVSGPPISIGVTTTEKRSATPAPACPRCAGAIREARHASQVRSRSAVDRQSSWTTASSTRERTRQISR